MKRETKEAKVPLDRMIALLNDAAAGRFEQLACPKCHNATVSVWFTNPAKDEFRTWFLCSNCSFHTRAQNSVKPAHFCTYRVRADLEASDQSILSQAIFKRPH